MLRCTYHTVVEALDISDEDQKALVVVNVAAFANVVPALLYIPSIYACCNSFSLGKYQLLLPPTVDVAHAFIALPQLPVNPSYVDSDVGGVILKYGHVVILKSFVILVLIVLLQ